MSKQLDALSLHSYGPTLVFSRWLTCLHPPSPVENLRARVGIGVGLAAWPRPMGASLPAALLRNEHCIWAELVDIRVV